MLRLTSLVVTAAFASTGFAQSAESPARTLPLDAPARALAVDPPSRALALELTASARLAGTSGSLQGAKVVARHLEAAGWRVEFDEHVVLLSLPRKLGFAIYADSSAKSATVERVERFDPDAIPAGDVPLFNAWSASAKVRAKVVDTGFGLRADYERLKAAKVEVRGCIALAKYGHAYRGVKAQMAEENGCVGVLLYSDSKSDGGEKGAVWPEGPWKPDWDGQRGSILPVSLAPGDPSTPGFGAPKPGEASAWPRANQAEIDAGLPHIPCLPIGVRDARSITARLALDASGAPLGPGPVEVELDLEVPRELRTIRNVIATLPGETAEFVIAGGHRDAWVRGANDNGSGCVALLRVAQLLGERAASGWKPKRTLRLAFWDAEEFGLIGSTEWGEANADWLRNNCLVYVNIDASVSGTEFSASGSPGMLGVVQAVAARQRTVDGSKSLWEDWCARTKDGAPSLGLPGAGSDDAVFAHHLCIPVLSAGFGGNDGGGYHTTFDDFALVERYLDPGFVGHEMLAKFLADLMPELAARNGAGFDVAEAADYFAALASSPEGQKSCGEERAVQVAAGFRAVAERARADEWSEWSCPQRFYRELADPFSYNGREWFQNSLWAPALDNGYGVETFAMLHDKDGEGLATSVGYLKFFLGQLDGLMLRLKATSSSR